MESTLVPVAMFLSFTVTIIAVVRLVTEARTRRRLIEMNATPELARTVITASAADLGVHASLQWGLVTGAVGLALVLVQYLPFEPDEPIAYGVVLLFASAGMVLYHVLGRRLLRQRMAG
jgi:hypothetical protein